MNTTDTAASLPGQTRFKVYTAEELVKTEFKVEYVVDDVLVSGQPCVMAGPIKCLKTSLAVDLAISVATATPFLGRFNVAKSLPVAIFSGESGASALQKLVRRICEARGVNPEVGDANNLHVIGDVPRLDDSSDLWDVERIIVQHGIKLLMIDPAYRAFGSGNEASMFAMGDKIAAIDRMCRKHGVTLVILHHFGKVATRGLGFGKPTLENLAYAGFAEYARQWLLLNRRRSYEPGSGYHDLWLNVGGSEGHQDDLGVDVDEGNKERGRGWKVQVLSADDLERERDSRAKKIAQAQADLDFRVVAFLTDNDRQAAKQIREGLKPMPNSGEIDRSLERLEVAGSIVAMDEKRPRRRDPVRVYSLMNSEAA